MGASALSPPSGPRETDPLSPSERYGATFFGPRHFVCKTSPPPKRLASLGLLRKTRFANNLAAEAAPWRESVLFDTPGFVGQGHQFHSRDSCAAEAAPWGTHFVIDSWLCGPSPAPDQPLGRLSHSQARCAAEAAPWFRTPVDVGLKGLLAEPSSRPALRHKFCSRDSCAAEAAPWGTQFSNTWLCWPSPPPKQRCFVYEAVALPKRRLEGTIFWRLLALLVKPSARPALRTTVLFTSPLRCQGGGLEGTIFLDSWLCWPSPPPKRVYKWRPYGAKLDANPAALPKRCLEGTRLFTKPGLPQNGFGPWALEAPTLLRNPPSPQSGAKLNANPAALPKRRLEEIILFPKRGSPQNGFRRWALGAPTWFANPPSPPGG